MKKVLIQNSEQLELVKEEIRVSSLFTHPNLLPLLDHAIIAVKVIAAVTLGPHPHQLCVLISFFFSNLSIVYALCEVRT